MLRKLIDAICFRLIHGTPREVFEFRIAKLDLKPGDCLAVCFPKRLGYEQVKRMHEIFKKEIFPNNKVLIFEDGAELSVLALPPRESAEAA